MTRFKKWTKTLECKNRQEIGEFIKKYLHGTQRSKWLFASYLSPDDLTFLITSALKNGMVLDWRTKEEVS
jgi:hypothetical protein